MMTYLQLLEQKGIFNNATWALFWLYYIENRSLTEEVDDIMQSVFGNELSSGSGDENYSEEEMDTL